MKRCKRKRGSYVWVMLKGNNRNQGGQRCGQVSRATYASKGSPGHCKPKKRSCSYTSKACGKRRICYTRMKPRKKRVCYTRK